jgi:hypothetical protein
MCAAEGQPTDAAEKKGGPPADAEVLLESGHVYFFYRPRVRSADWNVKSWCRNATSAPHSSMLCRMSSIDL